MRRAGSPTLAIGLKINPYEYRCERLKHNISRAETPWSLGSVPRDGLVHRRVGVKATFEVEDLLEASVLEGLGDVGAAVAVVADHHGLRAGVELGVTILQLGHRDKRRALYAGELELPRLAHIE